MLGHQAPPELHPGVEEGNFSLVYESPNCCPPLQSEVLGGQFLLQVCGA